VRDAMATCRVLKKTGPNCGIRIQYPIQHYRILGGRVRMHVTLVRGDGIEL
jgi:hypothetical protein